MSLNLGWQYSKSYFENFIDNVTEFLKDSDTLGFSDRVHAITSQENETKLDQKEKFDVLFTHRRVKPSEVIELSCKNVRQLGILLHKNWNEIVYIKTTKVITEDLKKSAVWIQSPKLIFCGHLRGCITFLIPHEKAELQLQLRDEIDRLPIPCNVKFNQNCCGSNIELLNDNTTAVRKEVKFNSNYVFLSEPLNLLYGNYLKIKILDCNNILLGSLSFGLTRLNPSTTNATNHKTLQDSGSVPFFAANVVKSSETHSTVYIWLDLKGNIVIRNNNEKQSLCLSDGIKGEFLWPIFYLDGSINKISVCAVSSMNETTEGVTVAQNIEQIQSKFSENEVNTLSSTNVNELQEIDTTNENNENLKNVDDQDLELPDKIKTSQNNLAKEDPVRNKLQEDCVVCFNKKINAVLSPCGHLCLCMQCGLKLFMGNEIKECPICRIKIKKVIQTF